MRCLIAVATIVFAAALSYPARAEILIGAAGSLTGRDMWVGEQLERGAQLAVADINATGGVLGRQVRLVTAVIAFLASEGGGYVTGQNIRVDGGITRAV